MNLPLFLLGPAPRQKFHRALPLSTGLAYQWHQALHQEDTVDGVTADGDKAVLPPLLRALRLAEMVNGLRLFQL